MLIEGAECYKARKISPSIISIRQFFWQTKSSSRISYMGKKVYMQYMKKVMCEKSIYAI